MDLSLTNNSIDYRLRLSDEMIPCNEGVALMAMRYPSLKDGDHHFCGLGCLKKWCSEL